MDAARIAGVLIGTAVGDALGAPTEFLDVRAIRRRWPPDGPREPAGDPARVTDDTQMMLAVGRAVSDAGRPWRPDAVASALAARFVEWLDDPENNRAPGRTCLQACARLKAGRPWRLASDIGSKGCGANMRVMPVAVIDADADTRSGLSQLQSALTHGHPTALAASDATAFAIRFLADAGRPDDLLDALASYADQQRQRYPHAWLGDLYRQSPGGVTAEDFAARGWDEVAAALSRIDTADRRLTEDPCLVAGAGWVAEEALATGLLCFLASPDDPVAVVRRAACTSGDSDSIAAVAGALAGAHLGLAAWPTDWVQRIEYADDIATLASALSR